MTSVARSEFVRHHRGEKIDLQKLRRDTGAQARLSRSGVSMADLRRADRNRDGKIDAREAFAAADRLDNDGRARSLTSVNASGATAAGTALTGLAGALRDPSIRGRDSARRLELKKILGARKVPNGQTIADVARYRVKHFGSNYGVAGEWKSPNRRQQGNVRPDVRRVGNGAKGRWKCNLFGLDVLYQAGFDVPMRKGWYPVSTDIPRHSRGKRRYFDKISAIDFAGLTRDQKLAKIRALMKKAKPGDVIILDHAGPQGSDGGHTRIVVKNDGRHVTTAEARESSAKLITHDAATLGRVDDGEEKMYLLRPRRRR